jgi:broad specificity phosphatase PhoE
VRNEEHVEYLLPKLLENDPGLQALVERGLGSSKNYQKVIEAVFNYWVSPQCDDPRIQSWEEYSSGVRVALQELMQAQGAGKTVAVFTSGGTIATIVGQVLGLGGGQTYQFYEPIFNCSITQLFYSGDKVSLSYFNDRSYLQGYGLSRAENLVSYR